MRFVGVLILFCVSFSTTGLAQQTSHLAFVSEYICQLGANEKYRELAYNEITEKDADKLIASIRGGTRIVLVAVSKLAKDEEPDCQLQLPTHANASSSAFAFFRSAVSNPSVNQL
jgi:hypothetical protein